MTMRYKIQTVNKISNHNENIDNSFVTNFGMSTTKTRSGSVVGSAEIKVLPKCRRLDRTKLLSQKQTNINRNQN